MSEDKKDEQTKLEQAIDKDSIKHTIGVLVDNFIKEEAGNKVTRNNMTGLAVQVMGAIDGTITVQTKDNK